MEDGLLSLKWNNHKTTFFEILKVLRDKANYTDATLAVEGNFYPVHKLVLSTCSEYFSEIFERTPCKSPVIVLKDVRSQDLESLLDYMYLGEVNVNQNDLALLLKTAECLRIKGLAVPDEDPTRHSTPSTPHHHHHHKGHTLNAEDLASDTPPAKRRKEDSSSSATSAASPPRASPSARGPSSSPSHGTPTTTASSAGQPPNSKISTTNASSSSPPDHDAPLVKVEMEESEDGEDAFHGDDNYEGAGGGGGGGGDGEGRDFVEKAEHDPSTYPNTNFSMGSSQQQAGDLAWEDGENSFHQEAFGGDSSSQQAGGKCEAGPSSSSVPFVPLLQVTPMLVRPSGYRRHCPVCGKGFDQPYNLQRHIRTHTGERPFPCRFCAYAASERSHLKSHVARKHRQEYMNWSD